jgi:hypothetical protein
VIENCFAEPFRHGHTNLAGQDTNIADLSDLGEIPLSRE